MGSNTSALAAGAAFLLALAAQPAAALSITSLVVFGDSNVDIGRAGAEIDSGAPGDGVVPPPNTVAGRSSDGPILPEFVAERVGVPQLNFGFGGATAGETNILGGFGYPDLALTGTLSQIDEFEAMLGGGTADPSALYLVFAGSNDLALVDKNDQAAVDAAVADADDNLREAVTRLTTLGAEEIVVATRTVRPVVSDADRPEDEPVEAARNDAAGRQLNEAIGALVGDLDSSLSSDVMLFDDYAIIREIIAGSGSNGFTAYSSDPDQYCVNSAECSALINYDSAHKTSAVHSVLADRFIEQFDLAPAATPVPLPASVWMLAAGGAALLGFGRARRRTAA